MRYGPEQSEKTKQRVVKIAAAQIRKRGPDNVGVADVMKRAGLTHGGFYAHFASKEDLIAAAVTRMFDESHMRHREWTADKPKPEALRAFINAYVSAVHRDNVQGGCAVSALSSDIHRQGGKVRAIYDACVTRLVNSIANLLPSEDETKNRALAVSMLAEMTGAVSAARAVSDPKLSDEILAGARRALRARAGVPPSQHEGKAK